ncbi:hypothetical protein Sjap_017231 [Stephania japonica]|uniref:TF-B3 domain-containing protein n=1 Tax=Stephania japonica TaxID=461633 RepID=A0AAP0I5V7_9MAGN
MGFQTPSMVVNDRVEEDSTRNNLLINKNQVESTLNLNEFPSFVKYMIRSNVTSCFWLGLPSKFCIMYLPNKDCEITLVDENDEEYVTKYIVSRYGLSGGWRRFSITHGLVEGDTLSFHLVEAAKLEVTIRTAYDLDHFELLTQLKEIDSRMHIKTGKRSKGRRPRMRELAAFQPPLKGLENCTADDTSEVLEGIKLCQNAIKFEDVIGGQASFSVIIDGLNIDSELSDDARLKYYEICCSQQLFLHEKLMKGMNCKLVAGIISETVDIASAIEAGNLRLSSEEFYSLNTRLEAFEKMGMKVSFLRDQLKQAVVGTTKESKEMAKHSKLGQQKRGDNESGEKGNLKKLRKLSSQGAVDSKTFFEFRNQCTIESR